MALKLLPIGPCGGNSAPPNLKGKMLISKIVGELERERAMRVYVFPRLEKQGRLTPGEAKERMETLTEGINLLNELRDAGVHHTADLLLRLCAPGEVNTLKDKGSTYHHIKGDE